ncbi:MAG: IS110 family transposase [Flavobacteriaceae bacterium]|jgi:transposase|nr:IS110 family transposase [Flavobacteriaceae bacterium]
MKNYVDAVGIDVSKKTIDVKCHLAEKHRVFGNDYKGYVSMFKWVKKITGGMRIFYCFENTGNYSLKLATYLSLKGVAYVEESPITIKRSSGLVREKSDKIDASIIARYAWLYREELEPSKLRSVVFQEMGRLIGLRDQLVRNRAGLIGTLKETQQLLNSPSTDIGCILLKRSIDYLSKQIKATETRLNELLREEESLNNSYNLLLSMKGIGFVLACQLIYHTENFNRFKTWRQFSSYCGLAPFEYSSGTSIHRRKKCHYLGDRKMKSLLSMASISAIQHDQELRLYYKSKVAEGKPKMIALNNVRNKLLARAFAVVKRGTPYVVLKQYAA